MKKVVPKKVNFFVKKEPVKSKKPEKKDWLLNSPLTMITAGLFDFHEK